MSKYLVEFKFKDKTYTGKEFDAVITISGSEREAKNLVTKEFGPAALVYDITEINDLLSVTLIGDLGFKSE